MSSLRSGDLVVLVKNLNREILFTQTNLLDNDKLILNQGDLCIIIEPDPNDSRHQVLICGEKNPQIGHVHPNWIEIIQKYKND